MASQDWIALALVVVGFIAERAQFFSAESRQTIRVLVAAVNDPGMAKRTVKESPVASNLVLNAALDVIEPRTIGSLGTAPRVGKGRKIGRFLVGLLPLVSRIPAVSKLLF